MAEITRLDNGIKIVTEKLPSVKTVSVGALVKVGSRYESQKLNGISHFLEHMAFKGTHKRTSQQLAFEIDNVGGYSNAWTAWEFTSYYSKVLAEHVDLAIDIISDSLINSSLSEKEIEVERGVILQEINRSLDNPGSIAYDGIFKTAYKDQPVGREILGPPENVKAFTRKDFQEYMATHYGKGRIVVSAAGDVQHDQFVDKVANYFQNMNTAAEIEIAPAQYSGGYYEYNKNFEQSTVIVAWPGSTILNDDRFAHFVFSTYLGEGMSSPLFDEVREKRGLVYSIDAGNHLISDTGFLYVHAGTTAEHIEELLKVSKEEIAKVSDAVDMKHFIRAKNQIKVSILKSYESTNSRMEKNAENLHNWNDIPSLDSLIEKIDAVTVEDLKAISRKIFTQQPTLSIVGPTKDVDYLSILNG